MGISGYVWHVLIGGFIGSFFGIAGLGGAIAGTIPGAILGFIVAYARSPKTTHGDEAFYARVAAEWAAGEIDQALLAKAQTKTEFDERKAAARYIEERVDQLKRESAQTQRAQNQRDEEQRKKSIAEAVAEQKRAVAREIYFALQEESVAWRKVVRATLKAMTAWTFVSAILFLAMGYFLFGDDCDLVATVFLGGAAGGFTGWIIVQQSKGAQTLSQLVSARKRLEERQRVIGKKIS